MKTKNKTMRVLLIVFSILMLMGGQSWGQSKAQKSHKIFEQASVAMDQNKYDRAIELYLEGLSLAKDSLERLYELAKAYRDSDNYQDAKNKFQSFKSLTKNSSRKIDAEINILLCDRELKNLNSAIRGYEKLLKQPLSKDQLGRVYSNLGVTYDIASKEFNSREFLSKAKVCYQKEAEFYTDQDDQQRINFNVARTTGLLTESKDEMLAMVQRVNEYFIYLETKEKTPQEWSYIQSAARTRIQLVLKAYGYEEIFHDFIEISDTISAMTNQKHLKDAEAKHQTREAKLQAEKHQAESERHKAESERKGYVAWGSGFIVLLIAFFLFFVIQKNKKITKQRNQISQQKQALDQAYQQLQKKAEELGLSEDQITQAYDLIKKQHHNLEASIKTAAKTQRASLSKTNKLLHKYFSEQFVLYYPKDVVSGDFYWLQANGLIFLVIADCTGHGVPGAMMTMTGLSLLQQIIVIEKETNPEQIIKKLHIKIIETLNQSESHNDDGMDISLLIFDKDMYHVSFAGAKQSIIHVQTKSKEVVLYEGSRVMVGSNESLILSKDIAIHTISLLEGDLLFMWTDGLTDLQQLPKGAKFGTKGIVSYFEDNKLIPLKLHEKKIIEIIETSKINYPQRDDITVIGLKI